MKRIQNHKQSGFIAGTVLIALTASFLVVALAGTYVSSFGAIIKNQTQSQANNRLEEIADLVALAAKDEGGLVPAPPRASATAGGAPIIGRPTDEGQKTYLLFQSNYLPSGFPATIKNKKIYYYPFFYSNLANATPNGYFCKDGEQLNRLNPTDSGACPILSSIPKPTDIAFALVLTEYPTPYTEPRDAALGLAQEGETIVTRTVAQVAGANYEAMYNNIADIPNCSSAENREAGTVRLTWSKNDKKWTCATGFAAFALLDESQAVNDCGGMGMTSYTETVDGQTVTKLRCAATIFDFDRTPDGLYTDTADGNVKLVNIVNAAKVTRIPCGGDISRVRYTGSEITCNGVMQDIALHKCTAPSEEYGGQMGTISITGEYVCLPVNSSVWENGRSFARMCGPDATPFFAGGRTFCPGDANAGGEQLCFDGETAGFTKENGLGCYKLRLEGEPGGRADLTAIKFPSNACAEGQIMRIKNDYNNETECVSIFETLAPMMPTLNCPNNNGGPAALTWNANTKRFLCTTIR